MSWFQSLILGVVQGLTEFLPISSSAHIRLIAVGAGWPDPGAAFTAVSQIGTELAILIYFRKDIARIVTSWARSLVSKEARRELDARMGWLVIVGSIPIAVLGVTFKDHIEGPFRDLRLIAFSFIALGIALGVADRLAAQAESGGRHRAGKPRKNLEQLNVRDGVLFGLWQALALVPGMSRSGVTMTGGLFLGYDRASAARYSFLLAIPAVLGSGAYELKEIGGETGQVAWGPTILATVVGGLVGYAVIAWFMHWISTRSFMPFVWYRIAVGVVILLLVGVGVLDPMAGAPEVDGS
ncbi:undecaprenyl-diphosphate phosphatase [Streptomyces durbertensis]|uniref:Undecaprenyl-diphosphatase n=1 Tax=Streptomyces durbertensis TaxID=2448886 RepID=A0ABR6EDB7_9ACTN|nr:undecaprenyl-diphosphate phosphatase [Streptomyces durbertensis]MBB1243319.1 undecaprenyl-diphosphate phosphatase [Streptomyces durbertensis]